MYLNKIFLLFLYFCIGIHATAFIKKPLHEKISNDDSKFETIALNYLHLQENDCAVDFIIKKKLPYADKTVIVIPEYISESRSQYEGFDLNLHILLIDNTEEKVIAYYPNEFIAISDAIILNSISIDTGLFILNEEYRAFGIEVHHSNSRSSGYYNSSTLSLFIQKNNTLQMVLDELITEYDRGEYYGCEGEFETGKSVLIMSEKRTNNFKDIIIKTTEIHTLSEKNKNEANEELDSKFQDNPCIEKVDNFTKRYTLKYINGRYKKT